MSGASRCSASHCVLTSHLLAGDSCAISTSLCRASFSSWPGEPPQRRGLSLPSTSSLRASCKTWMPGTRPAMTTKSHQRQPDSPVELALLLDLRHAHGPDLRDAAHVRAAARL